MNKGEYFDYFIIGGGILGLAVAEKIATCDPKSKIVIAEKENSVAHHASGRNSGVIHAGFYYSDSSLKSRYCREGRELLLKFLKDSNVPFESIGKILICSNEMDKENLISLHENAKKNGVKTEIHPSGKISEFEPLARSSEFFLHSPDTSIADPKQVAHFLFEKLRNKGVHFLFNTKIVETHADFVRCKDGRLFRFKRCLNLAGAGSLDLAQKMNLGKEYLQLPILGGYLYAEHSKLPIRKLVYAVPDPAQPFLGAHLTKSLTGRVLLGPSAVPVFGPENYSGLNGFSVKGTSNSLHALSRLVTSNKDFKISHMIQTLVNGTRKKLIEDSQKLVLPDLSQIAWHRGRAGIRSQLVNKSTGSFENDFIVIKEENYVHALNVVSPGWTSSFSMATELCEMSRI